MYEHKTQPLLPKHLYIRRLIGHILIALLVIFCITINWNRRLPFYRGSPLARFSFECLDDSGRYGTCK